MASSETLMHGLADALRQAAQTPDDEVVLTWDEWHKALRVIMSAYGSSGSIVDAVMLSVKAGGKRDMLVKVLADHIERKTWG